MVDVTDEEVNGKEFDFKESVDEALDYWHTLRVTNTHSETTRAHGLVYFAENDYSGEELVEKGSEELDVVEGTVENWLDEFEDEGLLESSSEQENTFYSTTNEGEIIKQGLNEYASWIAENHPVTEQDYNRAALKGILDEFNLKPDVDELNPEEYVEKLEVTEKLHDNVQRSTNTKNAYEEAIRVMNELKGDRLEILGLFLNYGEEDAKERVEDGSYCIESRSGSQSFIDRLNERHEVVEKSNNSYDLTDKGKKAVEILERQAKGLENLRDGNSPSYLDGLTTS